METMYTSSLHTHHIVSKYHLCHMETMCTSSLQVTTTHKITLIHEMGAERFAAVRPHIITNYCIYYLSSR